LGSGGGEKGNIPADDLWYVLCRKEPRKWVKRYISDSKGGGEAGLLLQANRN